MEGSDGPPPPELTDSLSDWTLVSDQGELMRAEGESDSSESSIEVVHVEGNDVVSFHHGKSESCENQYDEDCSNDVPTDGYGVEVSSDDFPKVKNQVELEADSLNKTLIEGAVADVGTSLSVSENVVSSTSATNDGSLLESKHGDNVNIQVPISGASASMLPVMLESSNTSVQPVVGVGNTSSTDQSVPEVFVEDQEEKDHSEVEEGLINKVTSSVSTGGACCLELVGGEKRSESVEDYEENDPSFKDKEVSAAATGTNEAAYPVDDDEGKITQSGTSSVSSSRKGDSDTDSDFVPLDRENSQEANGDENNLGAVPLRRFSSIDENFSFMRGQANRAPEMPVPPFPHPPPFAANNADGFDESFDDDDIDRDDETESFTEEGVDDRIESEQSEGESTLNDVDDLSAFADIGDIPLVAGDVARNYIHQPNNRLSTALNVTLVLAAMLTMGMSLGIIMATDLEIEEWQSAYELQTIRVRQLELQLRERRSVLDSLDTEVARLESRTRQLTARLADTQPQRLKQKKTELALDWLKAHGIVEGGKFSHMVHLVNGVISVFVHCGKDYDFLTPTNLGEVENGSFVPMGPCGDKLNLQMDELRALMASEERKGTQGGEETLAQEVTKTGFLQDDRKLNIAKVTTDSQTDNQAYVPKKRTESIPAKDLGQATVGLDVRQMQQSLSREQERALHWQGLYLFERRQRERERETEEWEDERDKEQRLEWERIRAESSRKEQREIPDDLECLKKVLASNFSTLTQHVARWNVSLFDDFANLSALLFSVDELKQSVVDSVQKVWEGAGDTFGKMKEAASSEDDRRSFSESMKGDSFSMIVENTIQRLLRVIKSAHDKSKPHMDELLVAVEGKLIELREGLRKIEQGVESGQLGSHLRHAWNITGEALRSLEKEVTNAMPETKSLVNSLKHLLMHLENSNEIRKPGYDDGAQADVNRNGFQKERASDHDGTDSTSSLSIVISDEDKFLTGMNKKDTEKKDGKNVYDDDDDDDNDDNDDEEEDDNDDDMRRHVHKEKGYQRHFVYKGLSKIWSKTHKSFKNLGQKVARTFGEVKSIWDEKDQPLLRIAKHLTTKFVRASVKLSKIPGTLFKKSKDESDHENINSKSMRKSRKRWQKVLLKEPCKTVGARSTECHQDWKLLKQEMKEVSKLFYMLLKVKQFTPEGALALSEEDKALHLDLFKFFLERWGGRPLLLKKDLEWVACQRDWWAGVCLGKSTIDTNSCDILNAEKSSFPGGDFNGNASGYKKKTDQHNRDDFTTEEKKSDKKPSSSVETLKENVSSVISTDKEDGFNKDWYLRRERYRLQKRREREGKHFGHSSHGDKFHQRRFSSYKGTSSKQKDEDFKDKNSDWLLKKGEEREKSRTEDHKSDWVFERARSRRHETEKWYKDKSHGNNRFMYPDEENWALKQGHHRQQQRQEEHKADWVFNRAADRRQHQYCRGGRHTKNFRCTYGKASP